jgi:hypothetical protein
MFECLCPSIAGLKEETEVRKKNKKEHSVKGGQKLVLE